MIGLSVVMLGEAPGTHRLNEWVEAIDGGMSLDDIANHIAASDAFTTTYPTFLTNAEFAASFLANLMGSEEVPAALVTAAEGIVTGLLNDGMTRGALALAVFTAMYQIHDQGEDHAAYGDLGMVANGLFNKIAVAEHHTLNARMEYPSSSVLSGVSSDDATVEAAISSIDDIEVAGQTFVLTTVRDDIDGTSGDDLIVAEPVAQVSNVFQDTLNPFDDIDGGEGNDTIAIYGVVAAETLSLGAEQVRNVENVILSTVGAIDADMSSWEGLESVDLQRFGSGSDVKIIVDGAMVSTDMTFGGETVIVGAAGDLNVKAGGSSHVHIGSAGHTETVTVTGGGNITVGKNAAATQHSETVTSVSVTGVAHNTGTETTEASGEFAPLVDDNGYVVGQNGVARVAIVIGTAAAVERIGLDDDGVTLTNADTGTPLTVTFDYNHDDDDGTTPVISITAQLKFNSASGGIVLGEVTTSGDTTTLSVEDADEALNGEPIPAGTVVVPTPSIGKEDAAPVTTTVGGGPTLTVKSNAIADVSLTKTTATILVENGSKTEDDKNMPEDLAITLNEYGKKGTVGKLCVAGSGSAENIMLTVAGNSWVDLNSNVVKTLNVMADANLSLSVSKFNSDGMPDGASETLESVMISGDGAVSMNSLGGMKKLASIDASGSSGNNSFMSDAVLAALTSVMGGSGNDTVSLSADEDGKLESIMTGDGGDSVTVSGDYREDGLMVDLGDGDDSFDGNAGNSMSRVDGGAGRDTLTLSSDGATYKDGDKTMSIYSNFEVLDVGGGSGAYNVGRLGVDAVEIGATTTGDIVLNGVGSGVSLSVSGSRNPTSGAGVATSATVDYNLSDDVNSAGSLIDGNTSSILDVSLMAMGGKGDSRAAQPQAGEATLTLDLDGDLMGVIIDSNASVHGTAAGRGATSGHYENTVTVTASAIEEVKITGNARTKLDGAGLTALEYVNAAESGGGVEVDAAVATAALRLIGSQQDDTLTAGTFVQTATSRNTLIGNGGDDTLMAGAGGGALVGGAGADEMTGAGGTDLFVINSHSESQVNFKKGEDDDGNTTYTAEGFDTINSFTSGTDKLHFSKALHAIVTAGEIVGDAAISNGYKAADEWAGWAPVDTDGDPATTGAGSTTDTTSIDGTAIARGGPSDGGAGDLRDFIGSGKGLFLTSTTATNTFGSTTTTYKNSIAAINDTTADAPGLWLLVDVDGDGDFSAEDDMVIFIAGSGATFAPGTDISS